MHFAIINGTMVFNKRSGEKRKKLGTNKSESRRVVTVLLDTARNSDMQSNTTMLSCRGQLIYVTDF